MSVFSPLSLCLWFSVSVSLSLSLSLSVASLFVFLHLCVSLLGEGGFLSHSFLLDTKNKWIKAIRLHCLNEKLLDPDTTSFSHRWRVRMHRICVPIMFRVVSSMLFFMETNPGKVQGRSYPYVLSRWVSEGLEHCPRSARQWAGGKSQCWSACFHWGTFPFTTEMESDRDQDSS